MPEGFVVGVTSEIVIDGDRARSLYVVAVDSAEKAIQLVRSALSSGCAVDTTATEVSSDTVRKLDLQPGQFRHL